MSLDDAIKDDSCPMVCDVCSKELQGMGPTILGWQLLVFTCKKCNGEFCPHLESEKDALVCVDCKAKE